MPTAFQRAIKRGRKTYYAKKAQKAITPYSSRLPRNANAVVSVSKARNFPAYVDVCLKYNELFTINAGSGTSALHLFRANSVFDPNFTGVGHQPLGFDEWAAVYGKYRVIKSSCKIMACMNGVSTTSQAIFGVRTTSDSGTTTNITRNMEQTNCKWTMVTGSLEPKTLTCYWNIKSVASMSNEDNLNAAVTGNPVQEDYFQVFYHAIDDVIDADALRCAAEIEYTVRFFEVKQLGQS